MESGKLFWCRSCVVRGKLCGTCNSSTTHICCSYVVDDEDAKGEYYNWFGESQRLLGMPRVFFAFGSAAVVSFMVLPADQAAGVVAVGLATTVLAGNYGNSVLGGVMG